MERPQPEKPMLFYGNLGYKQYHIPNEKRNKDGIPMYVSTARSDLKVETPASIRGLVQDFNKRTQPMQNSINAFTSASIKDFSVEAFNGIKEEVDTLMEHLNEFHKAAYKKIGGNQIESNGFVAVQAKKHSIDLLLFRLITKLVRIYKYQHDAKRDTGPVVMLINDHALELIKKLEKIRTLRGEEDISQQEKDNLARLKKDVYEVVNLKPKKPMTPRISS